jgi:hypothetical protein
MTTPSPKRRWFQFSLRALLVFVLLVSIGMSWFAVKMQRARRQRKAVEEIRKAGGMVGYAHGLDDPFAEPSVSKWARELLGDDFFFDVVIVSVGRDVGDREASHLKALNNLTHLDLSYTQGTGAGLEHLERLTNLEWLDLRHTQVTDAGLEHLKGLTNLQWLDLIGTQVSDAGLDHLRGLNGLLLLDLDGTQVTPEGVEKLQEALPDCEINTEPSGFLPTGP